MSTSVKCGGCKDKSWRKCCDKCLDSLFECYICKGYFSCDFNNATFYISSYNNFYILAFVFIYKSNFRLP